MSKTLTVLMCLMGAVGSLASAQPQANSAQPAGSFTLTPESLSEDQTALFTVGQLTHVNRNYEVTLGVWCLLPDGSSIPWGNRANPSIYEFNSFGTALENQTVALPLPIYGTLVIILLAYTGRYVPLAVRSANAAFRQIDVSLEETARVTGAGWFRTFRSVTLPLARPGLFAGWLLVFVPALQELSASILLFSSGSITLAVAVYNLYETGALEPVAALAIVTMVIITAAIALATRLGRGGERTGARVESVAQ